MKRYETVAFFIVAHMDDWQLFMNPNATRLMSSSGSKTVFIFTTANDSGASEDYWRANEEAAISSARFNFSPTMYISGARDSILLHEHVLHRWIGGDVTCYFMRLPDGNLTGTGFPSQRYQSLQKLYEEEISEIHAIDGTSVYRGWQDVVNTIQGIISLESKDLTVIVNHPETDQKINPDDHSDHRLTGIAVQSVADYSNYVCLSYIGYDLLNYPVDAASENLFSKIGQFTLYDKTLHDLTSYSILQRSPSTFISFCLREARYRVIPKYMKD